MYLFFAIAHVGGVLNYFLLQMEYVTLIALYLITVKAILTSSRELTNSTYSTQIVTEWANANATQYAIIFHIIVHNIYM